MLFLQQTTRADRVEQYYRRAKPKYESRVCGARGVRGARLFVFQIYG